MRRKRLDSLIEVTTIYVQTSGEALTSSLYLGPTDKKAIPEGTYYLMRVDDRRDWFWEGMLFGAVFWIGVVIALLIGVFGSVLGS